ncbi:hypothetical protein SDC9_174789 [bioreactor metagenome]|uniref:Uncharacterized protein n=1 Tax=bioreactor metagenome TaxID=1076179 RepID=A0A645GKA5_9ZZZZ
MSTAIAVTPAVPPPPIARAALTSSESVLAETVTLLFAVTVPPSAAVTTLWNTSAFAPPATPVVPAAPNAMASRNRSSLAFAVTRTLPPAVIVQSALTSAVTFLRNTSTTIVAPTPTEPLAESDPARFIISDSSSASTSTSPLQSSLLSPSSVTVYTSVPPAVMLAEG